MDISNYIKQVDEFNKFERCLGGTAAVYTCDILTCISTLKCGSTFTNTTFGKNCRWRKIPFSDINWDRSHVFSLMSEPFSRRYKAMTEWLSQNGLLYEIHNNVELQNFVLSKAILDIHSYGYVYSYYKEYCDKIDWIPIDVLNDHIQVRAMLSMLLKKHQIYWMEDKWPNSKNSNFSSIKEKEVAAFLKEKFENNPSKEIVDYLSPDVDLYSRVVANFNKDGKTWDEISWLRV